MCEVCSNSSHSKYLFDKTICPCHIGPWIPRPAGFFEDRQIWEMHFPNLTTFPADLGVQGPIWHRHKVFTKHIVLWLERLSQLEVWDTVWFARCVLIHPIIKQYLEKPHACVTLGSGLLGRLDFVKSVRFGKMHVPNLTLFKISSWPRSQGFIWHRHKVFSTNYRIWTWTLRPAGSLGDRLICEVCFNLRRSK